MKQKQKKTLKKTTIAIFLLIIMQIFAQTNNTQAYFDESENTIRLNYEYNSNSTEICGGLASNQNYTNYESVEIDDQVIEHDYSQISIDNIQALNYTNYALTTYNVSTNSTYKELPITEYSISGGFDSVISTNLTYANNQSELPINTTYSDYYINSADNQTFETTTTNRSHIDFWNITFDTTSPMPYNLVQEDYLFNKNCTYYWHSGNGYGVNRGYGLDSIYQNGTIELSLLRQTDDSDTFWLVGLDSNGVSGWKLGLLREEIKAYAAPLDHEDLDLPLDEWSDIKIDFDCDIDEYNMTVNGITAPTQEYLNYGNIDNITQFYIYTVSTNPTNLAISGNYSNYHELTYNYENDFNTVLNSTIQIDVNYSSECNLNLTINNNIYLLNSTETTANITETFSLDNTIIIDFYCITNTSVNISYIAIQTIYDNYQNATIGVKYSINSLDYYENITANKISVDANLNYIKYLYQIDSSQFTFYYYVNDLYIKELNITIANNTYATELNINYSVSSSNWVVPSQINFRLNNEEIVDETYNSGYLTFSTYQPMLNFTSNSNEMVFNFSITAYFYNEIALDVISKTYLQKQIQLTSNHDVLLTGVSILFDADLKHTYINNIDYGCGYLLFPILIIQKGSSINIECILSESTYIELDSISLLENETSTFYLDGITNTISYNSISSLNYIYSIPVNFNLENSFITFSNLYFTEQYTHTTNTSYNENYETQSHQNSTITFQNHTNAIETYNVSSKTINQTITNLNSTYSLSDIELEDDYKVGVGVVDWGTDISPDLTDFTSVTATTFAVLSDYTNHDYPLNITGVWGRAYYPMVEQTIYEFSYWINFDSVSTNTVVFGPSVSEDDWCGGSILLQTSLFKYTVDGTNFVSTGITPVDDTWYHIHIESEVNNYQRIYIDGVLVADVSSPNKTPTNLQYLLAGNIRTDALGLAEDGFIQNTNRFQSLESISETTNLDITEISLHQVKNFTLTANYLSNNTFETVEISDYCFFDNSTNLLHTTVNISEPYSHTLSDYCQNYFAENMTYRIIIESTNSTAFNLTCEYSILIYYYTPDPSDMLPSISVGYQKSLYVNETNSIEINIIKSYYEIDSIWVYNNITAENETLGHTEGTYYKNYRFNESQYYSVEIFVNDTSNNYRKATIDNIFVKKNATTLSYSNLYNSYYQNSTFNTTIKLRENNRQINENISIAIYYPNSTLLELRHNTTQIELNFSVCGYYLINFTYLGSDQYLQSSIEAVFEILPIQRSINITDESIRVNSICMNSTNYNFNSSTLNLTSTTGMIFDCEIYFNISFSNSISYRQLQNYAFTFNQTTDITQLTINEAKLTELNFTEFYLNYVATNYTISNSYIDITEMVNTTIYNADTYILTFTQDTNEFQIQLDNRINSDTTSINMRAFKQTNRSYAYWYFDDDYEINSLELTRLSTSTIIETNNESTKYYFIQSSNPNEIYQIDYELNPEFAISYETIELDNQHVKLNVSVKSGLYIENITVKITYNYFSNWNIANQNLDNIVSFNISSSNTEEQYYELIGWNSNYNSTYTIVDSNTTAIQLKYSIFSYSNQTSITDTLTLNEYYGLWECANLTINQDYYSKTLSIILSNVNLSQQIFYFTGYKTELFSTAQIEYNNGTYTRIRLTAISHINQTVNETIDLLSYNIYNEDWTSNIPGLTIIQNEYTQVISFLYNFLIGTTIIVLIGTNSPPLANYSTIENSAIHIIEEGFTDQIEYKGYLEYPRFSTAFSLDIGQNWTTDGIHYENNTHTIINSTFFCDGYNENIITSYLKFKTNPIQSFTTSIYSTTIEIEINCSVNVLRPYIMFAMDESLKIDIQNDSVDEYYEYDGMQYFIFYHDDGLDPGQNIFIIEYKEYKISKIWSYLIPILLVVAIVGITYYRKRKEEKEQEKQEQENIKMEGQNGR
jgi:hypothetical protein